MKRIVDYFDRSPKSQGWLHRQQLKPNEIVEVNGVLYRYSEEREGKDRVLTPVK